MSKKPTLDEAFAEMPDGVHIGITYDMDSNEWYICFDQSPLRDQTYFDEKSEYTLAELIIASSKKWKQN